MQRRFEIEVEVYVVEGDFAAVTGVAFRHITNEGSSMQVDLLRQRVEFQENKDNALDQKIVTMRIPLTALEFLDFGFEVFAWATESCRPNDELGSYLETGFAKENIKVSHTGARLFWRDNDSDKWADASLCRGLRIDMDARWLRSRAEEAQ